MQNQLIVEFFRKGFIPSDNVYNDIQLENTVCNRPRASLLIESSVTTSRFSTFMKSGQFDHGKGTFDLKKPILIEQNVDGQLCRIVFKQFDVYTGSIPLDDEFGQTGRRRLHICERYLDHIEAPKLFSSCLTKKTPVLYFSNSDGSIKIGNAIQKAVKEFSQMNTLELCRHLTPYKPTERICQFFGNSSQTYSPLKLVSSGYNPDLFHSHDKTSCKKLEELRELNKDVPEEQLLQILLNNFIFYNDKSIQFCSAHEKLYSGWMQQVVSWENEYGEIDQKVCKVFQESNQTKLFIPLSSIAVNHCRENQTHCVSLLKKQRLLHLSKVMDQGTNTIFITDNHETAAINQRNVPNGWVFTGFICDPDKFEQVDFSPLTEVVAEIYILVTNDSGLSLEEKYPKAINLADHLKDKYSIEPKIIQVETDYKDKRFYFQTINDIMEHRRQFQPEVIHKSVMLLEYNEFLPMNDKMTMERNRPRFYMNPKDKIIEEQSTTGESLEFILWPTIARRKCTLVYAPTETGKTSVIMSTCAAIVAGQKPIKGKAWNVSTPDKYKYNKVFIADFESDQDLINSNKKTFAYPYFPAPPVEKQKCIDNLIVKNLKMDNTDYSLPANHQKFIDMIISSQNIGEKGQPVDMVVIDTYGNFTKADNRYAWQNVQALLKKLYQLNMAVTIIGHARLSDGELEGSKKKKDGCECEIKLYRKDAAKTDLSSPMLVETYKNRLAKTAIEKQPFLIHFNSKKFEVYDSDNNDLKAIERREFASIALEYQKKTDLSVLDVAKLLGCGKSQYHDKINKFRTESPDGFNYCEYTHNLTNSYSK